MEILAFFGPVAFLLAMKALSAAMDLKKKLIKLEKIADEMEKENV